MHSPVAPEFSQPVALAIARPSLGLRTIASLFAVVGGYMDAYSYLAHGHVFANAQTGNFVLLGLFAAGGHWRAAARHIPPIFAFALGVVAAQLVGVKEEKRTYRATLICQGIELAVLTLLACFGARIADPLVVPLISFVAAIQITRFGKLGPWAFNSAMSTRNLRLAAESTTLWLRGQNPEKHRGQMVTSTLACLFFLAGAYAGGMFTRFEPRFALAPCVGLVAVGILLTWRERRRVIGVRV